MKRRNAFRQVDIYVTGTRGIPDIQGGVEHHCEELYQQVVNRGLRVLLFTRSPYVSDERRGFSEWRGVRLRRLWAPHVKHFEAIVHTLLAVTLTRWYGGKLLHVHTVGCGLAVPYARLLGLKVLFTHHGFDYNRQKWNALARWVLRLGERFAVRFSNTIIGVSQEVCTHITEKYHRESIYLPNGVRAFSDGIPQLPAGDSQVRLRIADGPYLCAVGRLVPEKGFHTLLDAHDAWRDLPPLVIVGDADHHSTYAAALKKRENSRVQFAGKLPHEVTMDIIARSQVLIVPSFLEGLPIVVLEGLSAGALILASDIPPHQEILGNSEFGVLFRAGDARDLGEGLRAILALSHDEKTMRRRRGQEIARIRYDWGTIAEGFIHLIRGGMMP